MAPTRSAPAPDALPSAGLPAGGRLRWRARRGLLENDLILARFLDRHQQGLDAGRQAALMALLELPDTELFDLLMGRSKLAPAFDDAATRELLEQLRGV